MSAAGRDRLRAIRRAVGRVLEIYRYPVKSMAGARLTQASLGWHGLEGDRRFAFRRRAERGGLPWLTASRLPELILYRPCDAQGAVVDEGPTHVRTPDGRLLDLWGEADASVQKAAVRLNGNNAGAYATVLKPGRIAPGQELFLVDDAGSVSP